MNVRLAALAMSVLGGGCVFPSDDATGVELSWRFLEVNDVDGEDLGRVRSCAGSGVDSMFFAIVDLDRPDRWGTFEFACEVGFQTPSEFQTEASDAFIRLKSGDYDAKTFARGPELDVAIDNRTLDVLGRGLTVEGMQLAFEPVTLDLQLTGTESCREAWFALRYEDPELILAEPPREDDAVVDVLYRKNLASERGLLLGDQPTPCSPELAGVHRFFNVDPGRYRLVITIAGQPCARSVVIAGHTAVSLDLANLGCDG